MTRSELDVYRNTLSALIRRIGTERTELRHSAMQAVGGDRGTAVAEPMEATADPATAAGDSFLAMSLLNTEEQLLSECQAALERVACGTFGRCEKCHKPIARERLKAAPYARHCVPCVRAMEADEGT